MLNELRKEEDIVEYVIHENLQLSALEMSQQQFLSTIKFASNSDEIIKDLIEKVFNSRFSFSKISLYNALYEYYNEQGINHLDLKYLKKDECQVFQSFLEQMEKASEKVAA